ncbi:hypothetical protein HPB47_027523 [Ixodes persulcatus]|uniref:Uncharacterized protein n=1 Tax=Ixodes persulcatus TaxID=34615 RepID=A0AC60PVX7_IXOPE|nr:hypothetical protein HPB47_027523 [Ixodes persulcatus]
MTAVVPRSLGKQQHAFLEFVFSMSSAAARQRHRRLKRRAPKLGARLVSSLFCLFRREAGPPSQDRFPDNGGPWVHWFLGDVVVFVAFLAPGCASPDPRCTDGGRSATRGPNPERRFVPGVGLPHNADRCKVCVRAAIEGPCEEPPTFRGCTR